jgi:5-hydroxyisourate hydrolase-like protein (transthyretin family)
MSRFLLSAVCFLVASGFAQNRTAASSTGEAPYRIAGTVVDSISGAPLNKVRVLIAPTGQGAAMRTFITATDGRFWFDKLDGRKYSILAERHGYAAQGYDSHEQYGTAIVTGPAQKTESLVFRLKPASTITGHVLDHFGEPLRDATVYLFYAGLIGGRSTVRYVLTEKTDDLGMYRFQTLPAGKYFVGVYATPWFHKLAAAEEMTSAKDGRGSLKALDIAYPLTYFPRETDWRSAQPITLKWGQSSTADFWLFAAPAIHVQIGGADEQAQVKLLALPFDVNEIDVLVESQHSDDGGLEFGGIAPGHYLLQLSLHDRRQLRSDVQWTGDVAVSMQQLLAKPTSATVSGAILFDDPAYAPQSPEFIMRNLETHAVYRTGIGPGGTITALSVPPGPYEAHVGNAGRYFVWGVSAEGAQASGTRIDIIRPGRVKLSAVATQSLGTVEGVVKKDGTPVAGVMVVLVPVNPGNISMYRRDQTDSDGTFALPSVLPGDYTVFALSSWELEWSNPEVIAKYLATGTAVRVSGKNTQSVEVKLQ